MYCMVTQLEIILDENSFLGLGLWTVGLGDYRSVGLFDCVLSGAYSNLQLIDGLLTKIQVCICLLPLKTVFPLPTANSSFYQTEM